MSDNEAEIAALRNAVDTASDNIARAQGKSPRKRTDRPDSGSKDTGSDKRQRTSASPRRSRSPSGDSNHSLDDAGAATPLRDAAPVNTGRERQDDDVSVRPKKTQTRPHHFPP